MPYFPVIGLEIHIELKTNSKMFCGCANDPDEKNPNVNICPVCMGHPGTLPVINGEAVKKVIKTGLSLNCQIPENSKFDRKNYFYPDLPKGYQISQYDKPLCGKGFLEINGKKIRITRVHLEEDTGRLVHPVRSKTSNGVHPPGADYSLVDFNRAGIPLMELVTEPDIRSGKEAKEFAQELQLILRYLGVSDADMEKGQLRVEANISLAKKEGELGTKVEIKNLNSFRSVEQGIDYEIERQAEILKAGKKIIQETRGWNEVKGETFSQREKEEAHDYRYFPEPDLPPMSFDSKFIGEIKAEIPELPQRERKRLAKEYNLNENNIEIFVFNKDLGVFFEKIVSEFESKLPPQKLSNLIKLATNYLITDLQGLLQNQSITSKDFLITPENFAEFISLIEAEKISSKSAKNVLLEMYKTGADPSHIVEEGGHTQLTDEGQIEKIIHQALLQNPKTVEDYKAGKTTALQFLVGQVMKESRGKANPELVNRILQKKLK